MKNLHVIATDNKPSRLYFNINDKEFQICEIEKPSTILKPNRHIYITNDEDINENDYIITKDGRLVEVSYLLSKDLQGASKIILTTDTDLIKNGVQAIDDEFLEWFVAHPSCEEVEVEDYNSYGVDNWKYLITIPKEEPKQEFERGITITHVGKPKQETTLEEAAEKYFKKVSPNICFYDAVEFGAKWQQERDREFYFKYIKSEKDFQIPRIAKLGINTTGQCFEQMVTSLIHLGERSYSEEEVLDIIHKCGKYCYDSKKIGTDIGLMPNLLIGFFEQFKKK